MSGTETPAFPAFDEPFRAERSPFLWLLEPEVLRFLTIWRYSVVGLVLSTVLFVVVFGSALGRHADTIDGIGYGSFIVPGLFTQAIVNVGFFNGTTSLFEARHDQYVDDVSPARSGGGSSTRHRWAAASPEASSWARASWRWHLRSLTAVHRPAPAPCCPARSGASGRRAGRCVRGWPRELPRSRLLHGVGHSAAAGLSRRSGTP